MNTHEAQMFYRHLEGAIAEAIVEEWRLGKGQTIYFPTVIVLATRLTRGDRLCSSSDPDWAADGFTFYITFSDSDEDWQDPWLIDEERAKALVKNFRDGRRPSTQLRGKVRKMIDRLSKGMCGSLASVL